MINNLAIVIPAWNEEKTIANIVSDMKNISSWIIVVDDGSSDQTDQTARLAGADVIRLAKNSGYDAAISAGLNHAFKKGAIAAVTCDADGQHQSRDVMLVAEQVINRGFDFSAGIRDFYNRPVEKILGIFARFIWKNKDPFCGLKCYHRKIFECLGEIPSQLNIQTQVFAWIKRKKLKASYVSINVLPRRDHSRFGPGFLSQVKLTKFFFLSFIETYR